MSYHIYYTSLIPFWISTSIQQSFHSRNSWRRHWAAYTSIDFHGSLNKVALNFFLQSLNQIVIFLWHVIKNIIFRLTLFRWSCWTWFCKSRICITLWTEIDLRTKATGLWSPDLQQLTIVGLRDSRSEDSKVSSGAVSRVSRLRYDNYQQQSKLIWSMLVF